MASIRYLVITSIFAVSFATISYARGSFVPWFFSYHHNHARHLHLRLHIHVELHTTKPNITPSPTYILEKLKEIEKKLDELSRDINQR